MRLFVSLCLCFEIIELWNRSLCVCGHGLWHDDLYNRRYDHFHGKYSNSELMVDVINNLGLNILMVHNKDNDNNIAFSPYGAGVILIALGEGLQGEALYEIRKTLQLPYDGHTIRVGLRDIHRHLKTYFIPREGFLAGITLNSENVTIKPKYIELLRFYGYDIDSFNTALYPETHMTTEMTTIVGREETTSAQKKKIDPTFSTTTRRPETTSNIEGKEESTTAITLTSEMQTTVSTSTSGETTTVLTEPPNLTTEEVETTVTTEANFLTQTITSPTSEFPEETSSPPLSNTDNIITTPTTSTIISQFETSSRPDNIVTSTTADTSETTTLLLQTTSNPDSDNTITSTTPITYNDPDIITTPTTTNEPVTLNIIIPESISETTTLLLQQTENPDLENVVTSTTENYQTTTIKFQQSIPTTNEPVPSDITIPPTISETTTLLLQQTKNPDSESILTSTTENYEATTIEFQQTTPTTNEPVTTDITTRITISETTTLSTEKTTNLDSENIVTSTEENSVTTPSPFEQSTNNDLDIITIQTTNEPVTSTASVDSTEVVLSTQEPVTQPSSLEAGTVEVFSNESTNNIALTLNNQTFLIPRPRSEATNISVNVRISTDSSDDDLSTTENIQSRNARSIKFYKIDSSKLAENTNIFSLPGENKSIWSELIPRNKSYNKIKYDFVGHETHDFTETLPQVEELLSSTSHSRTKTENINLERIEFSKKDIEFDTSNYEIQINNTIYITENQNLGSDINLGLGKSSRVKTQEINNSQIRKPRSVEDYIITRQYDQPHHFRPPKPYLPQDPPFFLVDGKKEFNLDFMTYDTVLPFLYVQHLSALALAFPLDSEKYYLLLLLPLRNNGLGELICNIRTQNIFKYIINNLQLTHVKATIPSFNFKGRITLTNTLQKLGIRKIFQPRQADFSPMTDDENIYVTNIEQSVSVTIKNYMDLHKSQIYDSHHYYIEPVRFEVNRPFLYFVIDSEQQVILMTGKVVNPLNIRIK